MKLIEKLSKNSAYRDPLEGYPQSHQRGFESGWRKLRELAYCIMTAHLCPHCKEKSILEDLKSFGEDEV